MEQNSARVQQLAQQAYGVGSTVGVELPHSRNQELEADRLGLLYMARAGYDPRLAIDFRNRMAEFSARQGRKPVAFLSTHPVDKVRVTKLEELMPEAMAEYSKSGGR